MSDNPNMKTFILMKRNIKDWSAQWLVIKQNEKNKHEYIIIL